MITMPVRDGSVIDVRQSGDVFGHLENTVTVSAVVVGITGIDQQRFAAGHDEQSRGASFHVDKVNVESAVPLIRTGRTEQQQTDDHR